MSLRLARGQLLRWCDTRRERGFSNFLFVDQAYGAHAVLRRIFSLARKQGFQSVVIEEVTAADCATIAQDDEALARRKPDFERSTVHRLSFLRGLPDQSVGEEEFIGQAIFKWNHFRGLTHPQPHVYEAVIPAPRSVETNNFIHCRQGYDFHTSVGNFSAAGVLYAQQNGLTFVCAHVALRTALASVLPEADISYERINQIVGVDHRDVQVGGERGLGPDQMEAVLAALGVPFEKTVHEPHAKPRPLNLPTDYQRHLYGCIESGGPALLGFELEDPSRLQGEASRHVIPVFGHTFNEDAWVAEAQRHYFAGGLSYYPSESWLSAFVAHDDNFGPFYCLPRNFLRKDNFRLILGLKRCRTFFTALEAETLAFGYARILAGYFEKTGQEWLDRFSVFTRLGSLVIRVQCVTKEDYLAHVASIEDWRGGRVSPALREELAGTLPPAFWLAELSAPELFTATRHKFGELLLAVDQPPATDLSLVLAARLPGCFVLRTNGNLALRPDGIEAHTPLFARGNN